MSSICESCGKEQEANKPYCDACLQRASDSYVSPYGDCPLCGTDRKGFCYCRKCGLFVERVQAGTIVYSDSPMGMSKPARANGGPSDN